MKVPQNRAQGRARRQRGAVIFVSLGLATLPIALIGGIIAIFTNPFSTNSLASFALLIVGWVWYARMILAE